MNLETLPSSMAVAERAADLVSEVLASRRDARLVLPTGQTPIRLYRELVNRAVQGKVDLSAARIYQLDELAGVATDDQRSYHAFLRRTLVDHLEHDETRLHLLNGEAGDLDGEIQRHSEALREAGGADLTLLGLGRNGHVAFNEPGSAVDAPASVVDLHQATVQLVEPHFDDGTVPSRGLALGMTDIRASRRIVMLVTGAPKAMILKSVLQEAANSNRPASLLRDHAALTILADTEACALLNGEEGRAAGP